MPSLVSGLALIGAMLPQAVSAMGQVSAPRLNEVRAPYRAPSGDQPDDVAEVPPDDDLPTVIAEAYA